MTLPNCLRCFAYSVVTSSSVWPRPCNCAAVARAPMSKAAEKSAEPSDSPAETS
ncbi:Uncharacterised protein [Mycobacteroides abscessus subsp. abscessus]|nr:Uncharacterised protein [Mycobacteroides abscessus subsp. abscessus]